MNVEKMKLVKELNAFGWFWFFSGEEQLLRKDQCGKWMVFFKDQKFAKEICRKAILEGVCYECKCSDLTLGKMDGVICFYLNGDDIENHKRIIGFMICNELIPRTKTGRYYNNSFKFDNQTRSGEYGNSFEGKIKLSEFIDLNTGEWVYE